MSLSRCISYYMSFYYKRYKLREAAVPSLMTVCTKETLNYASLLKSYVLIFIVTSKPLALGGAAHLSSNYSCMVTTLLGTLYS